MSNAINASQLLFDTQLKTALRRIYVTDTSKLKLRLCPKTRDKRLYDEQSLSIDMRRVQKICGQNKI